ncbi:short-chain dehydrogenase [Desulfosporosinus sp. HMP52]|uniref:SDR family NAD(P)-dependent oxidoreductase n=1 Tax=Desulfosporosinus sp. HMP52 TaxID=1487923 RepID=UPI00051FEA08|nr:SDR family NAD(P)-dependent oxidoreductase [Desulfosporosinus sp. HMP52]KGK88278.1 short-chain dehydrogenase [Desulfosporosinus sp. HMP52]
MEAYQIGVITGATSGLGQLAAIELAKRGMKLVLTARSKERAVATRNRIKDVAPSAIVDFFYGDLSLMADVKRIGSEINTAYPKIDVLINNAGLHGFEQRITKEGFPEMIAVNYLAPWLLTHLLLDSLMESKNARIVNVASEASRKHGRLSLPEDLTDTSEFTAKGSSLIYGKTKLLNIMFTGELGRRLEGKGVAVNALNPGFNVTGLGRELGFSSVLAKILNAFHVGDPRKGTDIIVRLATDPQYQEVTGGYFNVGSGKRIVPIYPGGDIKMQNHLWDVTQKLLHENGFIN